MTAITVDIWADISCPWCFIGKRRFEKALSQFAGKDAVEVTFRSFAMAPDTPADFPGTEAEFLTANMGMDAEQVRAMRSRATTAAAGEGLEHDFHNVKHANTNLAHLHVQCATTHDQ